MNWEDEGFLISKNKYSENSSILEIYTLHHGKCSGILYGATSRKIKNYLQLGNRLHISLTSKNENKLGYLKVEIIESISPFFFEDKIKINCLNSSLILLKILTPELQSNSNIYKLYLNFFKNLRNSTNTEIFEYIFLEINLLKEIGFDMNLDSKNINSKNKNLINVEIDNENIFLPLFLFNKKIDQVEKKDISLALNFLGKYIEKKILIPNRLSYPRSRLILEKFFNQGLKK